MDINVNLKCPRCGFSMGAYCSDITEEERIEIYTCPCGEMMVETDELEAMVWEGASDDD